MEQSTMFPGLPLLYRLQETANATHTITPFLSQFAEVENVFYGSQSLWDYFLQTNPVVFSLHVLLGWVCLCLILSYATGNYSWVDRFWPIIPSSYTTLYVIRAFFTGEGKNGILHARLAIMWAMVLLWTIRLTRNYYMKGGYEKGSEDYRWNHVRSTIGEPAFQVLNVVFIAFLQNVLLWGITLPAYLVFLVGMEVPLNWLDVIVLEILIFAYVGQLRSDDLQLRYQLAKREFNRGGTGTRIEERPYEKEFSDAQLSRGFVTTEGWKVSRHPAFFLEQVVWATLYLWAAATSGVWWNYAGVGALAYILLFQCSTRLTESISASKYPAYKRYQQTVPMLCPIPTYYWNERAESRNLETKKDK